MRKKASKKLKYCSFSLGNSLVKSSISSETEVAWCFKNLVQLEISLLDGVRDTDFGEELHWVNLESFNIFRLAEAEGPDADSAKGLDENFFLLHY